MKRGERSDWGCTDAGACNFDAAATADAGDCDYTSCVGAFIRRRATTMMSSRSEIRPASSKGARIQITSSSPHWPMSTMAPVLPCWCPAARMMGTWNSTMRPMCEPGGLHYAHRGGLCLFRCGQLLIPVPTATMGRVNMPGAPMLPTSSTPNWRVWTMGPVSPVGVRMHQRELSRVRSCGQCARPGGLRDGHRSWLHLCGRHELHARGQCRQRNLHVRWRSSFELSLRCGGCQRGGPDGQVGAADLLTFLTSFGESCE